MPNIDAKIIRAWRHKDETGRIHYVIESGANEGTRHLFVDEGTPLYQVLDRHLLNQNYTGPKSAERRSRQGSVATY